MNPSVRVTTRRVSSIWVVLCMVLAWSFTADEAHGQPVVLQNFDGINHATSGYIPPDPTVAAGPNHVVEFVNGQGNVWNKTGGLVSTFTLDSFFSITSEFDGFDPTIRYDGISGRWFASEVAESGTPSVPSYVALAVSQSDDPTGSWSIYPLSDSDVPDYPRLGMNDDKVVVSFVEIGTQIYVVYILNKSELLAGSATDYVIYTPGGNPGTPQPVVSLTGTTTEYMIDNSFTSSLTLYSITGIPGVSPVNVGTAALAFRPTVAPPGAQQPGTSTRIDTFDNRLLSAVWRDGSLWTSANEGCMPPGDTMVRSCLRLIEATTTGTPLPSNSIQFAAIGDFNGDGHPDLAVANYGTDAVSILLGDGVGSFGPPADFAAGHGPKYLTIADFNGDGHPDLAVANVGDNTVSILPGDGLGAFGSPTFYTVGHFPESITTADFNGDGHTDLAVPDASDDAVSILLGNGDGTFGPAADVPVGDNPLSVAVGDFNGDGHPDLAVANFSGNSITVVFGNGDGTFGGAQTLMPGNGPQTVAISDLNGDGNADLAVSNFYDNTVSIFLGSGTGTFGSRTDFSAGNAPAVVAAEDLNGDGHPDLAVADVYASSVAILLGDGAGSFGPAANFAAGGSPTSLAIGDLNGDGKKDLAAAIPGANSLSIFYGDGNGSFGPPASVAWDPGPHVVQDLTYGAAGKYYFYPAVITDASGNLEVVFSRSSASDYADVRVTGRLLTDPPDTVQPSIQLHPGLTYNTSGRWGDYFGAALDPSDPTKVWVVGEYAESSSIGWGTRVAQLKFGDWLTVTKSGTGGGTVSSGPSGIDCGTDCSELFDPGAVVALTAVPDSGSIFAGWSGDPDCSDGVVTMDADKTCAATFNIDLVPDLIMTEVSTATTAVAPGKTFTLSNTVMNQGNASAGSFVIAFHLSTNTVYGDSDDISFTYTRSRSSLGIGASSAVNSTLTVPSGTPLGYYYICAMADSNNSVDEGSHEDNNTLCTAVPIQVTLPDLIMTDVTPQAATVNQGDYLLVDNTVKNQGLVPTSSSFKIAFRLSVNTTYGDSDDVAITATRTVSTGFAPGASNTATTNLLIPSTTPANQYYLCAMADSATAVAETYEDNNTLCSGTQVTVPPPDLVVPSITTTYPAVAPGKNFTVSTTVMNQGGSKAGSFTIAFHLSADATYGGTDDIAFTATRSLSVLGVGASNTGSTTLTVSSDTPLGSYYVCAFADSEDTVDEGDDENNNSGCTPATIEVTLPDLIISAVSPNASSVNRGSSLSVANSVTNQSLVASTAFRIGFRLSPSDPPGYDDPNGVAITTIRSVTSLGAGATSTANKSVTIPSSTPPGVYYVCAMADTIFQVAETAEDNNTLCSGNTVTVQ
jgi:FG-GAP-like repeat/CARDB/Divergent InlB B-repeat domain/FG-GAP repeat